MSAVITTSKRLINGVVMSKIELQESFDHGQSIRDVILTRSNMIDEALIFLWKYAETRSN